MKQDKKIPVCLLFLLLLAGCVNQADWPMPEEPPDLIVVEAVLTDEQKAQRITITRPVDALNTLPEPVTGATVLATDADSLWLLSEDPQTPGQYLTDSQFVARLSQTYTLQILWEDKTYSAQATMVPGKVFNELVYKRNDEDDLYHIDWVASAFSADFPAMWEVLVDWSAVPGFEGLDTEEASARLLFYTLSTIDVSQVFAPVVEQTSFPAGSIITERRYSLSPGHAEYLRQLLLETSWQGSLFPTANANVITNLSPGAAGYFGVCAVTELSLVVE